MNFTFVTGEKLKIKNLQPIFSAIQDRKSNFSCKFAEIRRKLSQYHGLNTPVPHKQRLSSHSSFKVRLFCSFHSDFIHSSLSIYFYLHTDQTHMSTHKILFIPHIRDSHSFTSGSHKYRDLSPLSHTY